MGQQGVTLKRTVCWLLQHYRLLIGPALGGTALPSYCHMYALAETWPTLIMTCARCASETLHNVHWVFPSVSSARGLTVNLLAWQAPLALAGCNQPSNWTHL